MSNIKKFITITILSLCTLIKLGHAQTINLNDAEIQIGKSDLVFHVKGMVCSFCAYGLQKSLGKLDFIDKSRYTTGTFIDINNQFAQVAIKPGKEPNIGDAVKVIKNAGYEVQAVYINPSGKKIEKKDISDINLENQSGHHDKDKHPNPKKLTRDKNER